MFYVLEIFCLETKKNSVDISKFTFFSAQRYSNESKHCANVNMENSVASK